MSGEVKKQTKRCIRDVLATAGGATLLPDAAKGSKFVGEQFGSGGAVLWFSGRTSSMTGAAFYNSFLVDSLDYHDFLNHWLIMLIR